MEVRADSDRWRIARWPSRVVRFTGLLSIVLSALLPIAGVAEDTPLPDRDASLDYRALTARSGADSPKYANTPGRDGTISRHGISAARASGRDRHRRIPFHDVYRTMRPSGRGRDPGSR